MKIHTLVATLDGMNSALFRLGIESCFGPPEAGLWMSTWTVPEDEVRDLQGRFDRLLEGLFPRTK